MIFESKYRRQAMQLWEQSNVETKKELVEELKSYQDKWMIFKDHLRQIFMMNPNKRSSQ